ncbi:hypothetical protein [Magnetococcus sp. PR-3]
MNAIWPDAGTASLAVGAPKESVMKEGCASRAGALSHTPSTVGLIHRMC